MKVLDSTLQSQEPPGSFPTLCNRLRVLRNFVSKGPRREEKSVVLVEYKY